MDMNLSKLWEIVEDRGVWHAATDGVTKSQTQLSNYAQHYVILGTKQEIIHKKKKKKKKLFTLEIWIDAIHNILIIKVILF